MFSKELLMMSFAKKVEAEEEESGSYFSFVASTSKSNINIFPDVNATYHPESAYTVYINDEPTTQSFTSLTFANGDTVKIVSNEGASFPGISFSTMNCVLSTSVLPYMTSYSGNGLTMSGDLFGGNQSLVEAPGDLFSNNPQLTSVSRTFQSCYGLREIPQGLLKGMSNITGVSSLFESCKLLTSVPDGFFDDCPNIKSLGGVFSNCSALTTVPENLFEKLTRLTSVSSGTFSGLFYQCSLLSGRFKFTSTNISSATDFCKGAGAITVIVPAGSTTETTFRTQAEKVTNLTVETYEP